MQGSENQKEIPYKLLKGYFGDLISEEGKREVQGWLDNSDSNTKHERYLRNLWDDMEEDANDPSVDLDAILNNVHHRINLVRKKDKSRSIAKRVVPVIQINTVLRNAARIAAILLLPVLGYLAWEVYSQQMWIQSQTEVVYNEIICPMGSRSQFELPDGTRGSLNNGSRLKYPLTFTGNTRQVELVGEAYFDVLHNKKRPFIINTDGLNVKVLGTRLNVYSYPGEGYQEFTLESGSAELILRENDQEITVAKLKPGQHVVYTFENHNNLQSGNQNIQAEIIQGQEIPGKLLEHSDHGQEAVYKLNNGILAVNIDETQHYTAWKDGKLVLRNDPMPNLLTRIERWYNVKFNVLDESINEYTFWATFEEENLDQVLELLSLTGPIEFEKLPKVKLADGTFKIQEINIQSKK